MKISASIYSSLAGDVLNLVRKLDALNIDALHVDCFEKDYDSVARDLVRIRRVSSTPIDFHAITNQPQKYIKLAEELGIEQLTFQYENLEGGLSIPKGLKSKIGLSLVSGTDLSAITPFENLLDFVLLMTTEPGVSGGSFNKENFQRIRDVQSGFPELSIHVDGGINAEVSFILRLLGVDSAVSGSFLVNHEDIAFGLSELRFHQTASAYSVSDYMMPANALPVVKLGEATFHNVITTMDKYALGFVFIVENDELYGVCSNADLRKGIIKHLDDLNNLDVLDMINSSPIVLQAEQNTSEMIELIKETSFPLLFLPVVDKEKAIKGAVLFNQLIKGEG